MNISWHSKSPLDAKKILRIVLYYFCKRRFEPVNKLNNYWIGIFYQPGNRRMLKVLKTL